MSRMIILFLGLFVVACAKPVDTAATAEVEKNPLSAEEMERIFGKQEASVVREAAGGGLWILTKVLVYTNNCSVPKLIYGSNFRTGYSDYVAAMAYASFASQQFYQALRAHYGYCPQRAGEIRWAQVKNGPGEGPGGGYLKAFNGLDQLVAHYNF